MARQNCFLALVFGLGAVRALAQNAESARTPESGLAREPAEVETAVKALERLTPEQRQRFHENFLKWSNLSPEEKKALRDRDEFRRTKMLQEMQTALRDAGLKLEGPQRMEFIKRYGQERRRIEEQLRNEAEEKRRVLLKEALERLKKEFAGSPPAVPVKPAPPAAPVVPVVPVAP